MEEFNYPTPARCTCGKRPQPVINGRELIYYECQTTGCRRSSQGMVNAQDPPDSHEVTRRWDTMIRNAEKKTNLKLRWEDSVMERAMAVVSCWLEDCRDDLHRPVDLERGQLGALLHQVEVGLDAQRTEYHVEDE